MGRTLINKLAARQPDIHPLFDQASGCGGSCATPPARPARLAFDAPEIRVNGVRIDEAEIAREAQHHEAASLKEARACAARALIIRYLLLARARELGLSPAPERDALGRWEGDEDALIRQLLETEAQPIPPTADECRRVHQAKRAEFAMEFEAAEPIIRDRLMARAWMAASMRYVARLVRTARIEGLYVLAEAGP